jgi:hypothetical protein
MLLQLTAKVDAIGFIDEPAAVAAPPYAVELRSDAKNRIVELRVQKQFTSGEVRAPERVVDTDEMLHVDLTVTDPHFGDLLDLVQYLKSIGSF